MFILTQLIFVYIRKRKLLWRYTVVASNVYRPQKLSVSSNFFRISMFLKCFYRHWSLKLWWIIIILHMQSKK